MRRLQLGVLDQAPISEGETGGAALRKSLDLAKHADQLGYTRYWVAEHHGAPALACTAPEALIGPIAQITSPRLRVGSGGIMLPHYSTFKVAETFSLLAGLYPGRIDLGLGRAPGSDPLTALAMRRDPAQRPGGTFPEQLNDLLGYLEDRLPSGHTFAHLPALLPGRPETPEPWLLGSSSDSGVWAAERGLPYMFADFISSSGGEFVTRQYRRDFTPSANRPKPYVGVALRVVCQDTDEEAWRVASSGQMLLATMLQTGKLIPVPSVETALNFFAQYDLPLKGAASAFGRRVIVGAPETVRAEIEAVARDYNADEVMLVTITYDHEARRRSYDLIAQAFGLDGGHTLAQF